MAKFAGGIRREGLRGRKRHHVQLSPDQQTARAARARRGSPIVLSVRAAEMHAQGHASYLSNNGVWLTEGVPPEYLDWLEQGP